MAVIARRFVSPQRSPWPSLTNTPQTSGSTTTASLKTIRRQEQEAVGHLSRIFPREEFTISIILGPDGTQPTVLPGGPGEGSPTTQGPDAVFIPLPTPSARQPGGGVVKSMPAPSPTRTASSTTPTSSSTTLASPSTTSTTSSSSVLQSTVLTPTTISPTSSFVALQSDLQTPSASASPATGAGGTQKDVLPTQGGRVAAIGIAAGVFAGVAFIVMTAAFIYRYRKRKSAAAS
ncbi:hypothetical protein L249_6524 [Ophiocordyceps polyrhachis-furcata BCC 54312]|uniref:Mid2 domain-containing protein n=1 Tax=Ophiocordyceps polyrhachis-furcata BCC 54312 TaxID=1330021 RepID=A0A367LLL8_9HYPO|nr:hypothetical protein L249_6524 [Ophiocordyceps polyrhachis-furcata BCC 54312]